MAGDEKNPVLMEGVRIIFRNFKGKPGPYNPPGHRNFGVILPDDTAERMLIDGWNVKRLKPSEEEKEQGIEVGPPWLQVKVAYDRGRPPKITMLTERGRTVLDEDTVSTLDNVDITNVDLIVNPSHYDVNGKTGIAAYLQTMFVTIEEDALERKYGTLAIPSDVPADEQD